MKDPLLSVVIPAYNVERFVAAAARSALAQTMPDLEVIVVDDGSTDDTAAAAAAIQDHRLRIVRQENRGLAGARNAGIRVARGVYLGFLDGDDLWAPRKAEVQISVMHRSPRIAMTYCHSAYVDERGGPTGEYLVSRMARPTLRQMIRRNHAGNGSTPILRAAAVRAVGPFDERLRTNGEDYEMWCRVLRRHGRGSLVRVPEPLTLYRIRSGSLSMSFDNFLQSGELANRILRQTMPEIPNWVFREGLASFYRVASRKAASAGRSSQAASYLRCAVTLAPWLPLSDPRVAATLCLILTGGRAHGILHSVARLALLKRSAAR